MRIPKPFFRKQTKTWYVQIGKKQHNLGPDEEAAKEKYGRLIVGRQPINDETTVLTILYLFLAWWKDNRAASTHEQYVHYIHSFGKFIGDKLTVEKFTPEHVYEWVDSQYEDQRDNAKRNANRHFGAVLRAAVQRN
jgi:hypothetical protein